MIRVGGFSGIVATIVVGDTKTMRGKLPGGERCGGILRNSSNTADAVRDRAVRVSAKHCFSGHMIAERCEFLAILYGFLSVN